MLTDLKPWALASLMAVFLAAFLATGYHHPDEYMQIIEFANLKLGGRSIQDMPWEFVEKMRPWLQPALFYGLTKLSHAVGIESPFTIWSLHRLLAGLLGWFSAYLLCVRLFSRGSIWVRASTFCLFAMPWFWTRASSESVSISLFVLGLVFYLPAKKQTELLMAGFLLGLGFYVRFQLGFMLLGLGLWSLIVEKRSFKNCLVPLVGVLLALLVGVAVDSWGYGDFVLSPYNYLYQNLVLNKAAQWGVQPFWYYLILMQNHGMAPLTILLTLLLGIVIYKSPKSVWVWMSVPFILIHSYVGHKEMRFLFPLLAFVPGILDVAMHLELPKVFSPWKWRDDYKKTFLVFNFMGFVFLSIWPSRTEVRLQSYVYSREIKSLQWSGYNPYLLGDLPVYFTKREDLSLKNLEEPEGAFGEMSVVDSEMCKKMEVQSGCKKTWASIPFVSCDLLSEKALRSARPYIIFTCDRM